ncbi:hypothetical protein SAMN05880593_106252 [Rhizobium sp. RU36D]|nr:hypothetical protein SAMN05880593_106252 [Rhizobium sp. RU36D]
MKYDCIFWDRCMKVHDAVGTTRLPGRIRNPRFAPCAECLKRTPPKTTP